MGILSKIFKAITGVIGDVVSWLTGVEEPEISNSQQGALLNKQSNVAALPVIYGQRKIGGTRVFVATSGANNQYLYIILALCEGEISAIGDVYINDTISTDSKYSGLLSITKYVGSDSQTADATFAAAGIGWTSDHKLSGVAYLAVRFSYSQDAFGGGLPNITAVVNGRLLYDPRTTNTTYSNNPALALYDYLTNSRYGKGLNSSLIDTTTFNAAATKVEALVTKYTGAASTAQIFTCNAVIDTSKKLFDNVKVLLSGMRGIMPFSNGLYSLIIDDDYASTFALDSTNIVGGIKITAAPKNKRYNRVTAKFTNPDANWQQDTVDFPASGSSDATAFLAADNDIELTTSISLPTITDQYAARDIARIVCLQSRTANLSVSLNATSEALQCSVGDVVTVTHLTPAWTTKEFMVNTIALKDDGEVSLTLKEHDSTIYPWDTDAALPAHQVSSLPDPFSVALPTSLTITETSIVSQDGTLLPSLRVNWTASDDAFVTGYEVQWLGTALEDYGAINVSSDETEEWGLITDAYPTIQDYGSIADAVPADAPVYNSIFVTNTQYLITGITPANIYNIKVRAINELGVRSAFVSIEGIAEGDTTAPEEPENLTSVGGLREITLSWTNPTALDLHYVEVWENAVDNFATSTRIAVITSDFFVRTGLGYNITKYYWIVAVDNSGNRSTTAGSTTATTLFVDSDAFSATVNSLFAEAGAYGIEPVASLPATGDFDGQIKFRTSDTTLWRWDAGTSAWTDDIFSITAASVTAASFAAGIEPISVVASLPSPTGYTGPQVLFLTTDQKLYRYDSAVPEFKATISTADLDGTVAAANFANSLRPIEVVATLPSTGNFEGRQAFLTSDDKVYRHTGSDWITAVAVDDLSGQIISTQISDDAITTPKLATGSVTADAISAGSIVSAAIAADAITSGKVAAGAIDADALTANSVVSGKIAAGAISTSALFVDGVIQGSHLEASTITGSKIAADTITGGLIAASGIITEVAQINDALISNAKIQNLAVTSGKIADLSVDTIKIADQAVTIPTSAFTAAAVSIPYDTLVSVQSVTWTSTGADTLVDFNCSFNAGSNPFAISVRVYLDGVLHTTLGSFGSYAGWTGEAAVGSMILTPSSGSRTLSIRLFAVSNTCSATARSLTVTELKK